MTETTALEALLVLYATTTRERPWDTFPVTWREVWRAVAEERSVLVEKFTEEADALGLGANERLCTLAWICGDEVGMGMAEGAERLLSALPAADVLRQTLLIRHAIVGKFCEALDTAVMHWLRDTEED